ncbi:phage portal protein [Microbispora triticiradicis]|uniref:phage portal protein n=1 Tax=Microbispora triticiradicis TaxID=2200763 RepID=UPI001AD7B1DE|nr:phage portal protein [Microbispora triticiradicis]MBO4274134.1 phage portal protein [Microbispora triticiradicis]
MERRQWGFEPPIPPNSAAGHGSYARVGLHQAEASLQKVAVWASVNLLAGTAAMLPVDVFTGSGPEQQERPMPTWMQDPSGEGYGLEDWIWQYMASNLLRGNVVGLIGERDARRGTPTQLVLQHPDSVQGWRDSKDGRPRWRVNGIEVSADQVWHRRSFPVPGRLMGLSPIAHHALTIGVGIAALRFGAQWFEEGAHPTGVLTSEANLQDGDAQTAKTRFLAAIQGRREPVVLGKGWTYAPIQIAPNESQFLETNNMTSAECCRIYGPGIAEILGYETGGSLTYQNIEQRNLQLLIYALDRWLTSLERALSALLPRPQYVKINRGALLRTDLLTRYRAYEIAIRNRFGTPNEARELEDRPPLTPEQAQEFPAPAPPAPPDNAPPQD